MKRDEAEMKDNSLSAQGIYAFWSYFSLEEKYKNLFMDLYYFKVVCIAFERFCSGVIKKKNMKYE